MSEQNGKSEPLGALIVPQGSNTEYRLEAAPRGGVDVRVFYRDRRSGQMLPGRENLRLYGSTIQAFVEALLKASATGHALPSSHD